MSLEPRLRRSKKPSPSSSSSLSRSTLNLSNANSFTRSTTTEEQTSCAMDGSDEIRSAILQSRNLHELLVNDDEHSKFLASLDVVKQLASVRADMVQSNVELARKNLERAAQIIELQNQCTVIRTGELAQAMDRFVASMRREKQVLKRSSLGFITEAAVQVDEQSKTLHKMFLAGGITLQDFSREYRKQRVLHYGRMMTKLALSGCT